jgi:hypothetical protein
MSDNRNKQRSASARFLASSGSRTPKVTSCPASAQQRPRTDSTLPMPMTAIRMAPHPGRRPAEDGYKAHAGTAGPLCRERSYTGPYRAGGYSEYPGAAVPGNHLYNAACGTRGGGGLMEQLVNPGRCCPECGSREYVFRGRKQVAPAQGQPGTIETKYRCKGCGKEWRVRMPV